MAYLNTTHSEGETLRLYEAAATGQEAVVLDLFRLYPRTQMTPSTVHRLALTTAPLTSFRRAITNLTTAGDLEKTGTQKPGPYGRPEYCWRLRRHSQFKPVRLPFGDV